MSEIMLVLHDDVIRAQVVHYIAVDSICSNSLEHTDVSNTGLLQQTYHPS